MSSPRDRDGADDGSDWQEPSHLSGNEPTDDEPDDRPNFADRRSKPRDSDHTAEGATWQPPGWDLPAATPERDLPATPDRDLPAATPERDLSATPDRDLAAPDPDLPATPERDVPAETPDHDRPAADPMWAPPTGPPLPAQEPPRGGLFRSRPRTPGELEKVFAYEGDVVGAQGWALQQGWTISDGNAPEDAVLRDLVASAPVRPTKDHRPASVLRGRSGRLDLVAFDIVYASGRYVVPQYAVTAAPLLGTVPGLRLSPARLWKHRIGGLVPIASGDEAFDTRWMLLAAEDSPQVRRLAQDPAVHGLLLGTDDGDEFWTAAGHLAAIRPDGHRPQLLEHHARLLSAVVGALSAGY